jgi:FkbM family methyltransferase
LDSKRIIYDFGANNGDDIQYYLRKADLVVAVEANPVLCEGIKARFSDAIDAGKLVLENCVITAGPTTATVPFYVHRSNHVLSQFPKPDKSIAAEFTEIPLPSMAVHEIVARWGGPYYIKTDLEHYDAEVLCSLFSHNIMPPFISAESHSAYVFCILVAKGNYNSFKLVDGSSVATSFRQHKIAVDGGTASHSFPHHSAGPFGEDIPGEWMTADNFLSVLAMEGLGWKDIHASNICSPSPNAFVRTRNVQKKHVADYSLEVLKRIRRRLAVKSRNQSKIAAFW